MKKAMKNLVLTLCLLLTVAGFGVVNTKAAGPVTGLHQTEGDTNSVKLAWDYYTGADNYALYISTDNVNFAYNTWSSTPDDSINSLGVGGTYYVKIKAYKGYNFEAEEAEAIAWSDSIVVYTAPADVEVPSGTVVQTAATTNSITLGWSAVTGAVRYDVYEGSVLVGSSTTPTFTRTGLAPGHSATYYVKAVSQNGPYTSVDSYGTSCFSVKTLPAKMPTESVGIANYWSALGEINFAKNVPSGADGVEIVAYNAKTGKKVYSTNDSSYFNYSKSNKNKFIKFRAHAYVTYGGVKHYGAWSGYQYFACQTGKAASYSKSIVLRWNKVQKASGYIVAVSKDGESWKKAAKLSSKKTSYTFKKYGKKAFKKNTEYYVSVTPIIKVGKKTYTSYTYLYSKATTR